MIYSDFAPTALAIYSAKKYITKDAINDVQINSESIFFRYNFMALHLFLIAKPAIYLIEATSIPSLASNEKTLNFNCINRTF